MMNYDTGPANLVTTRNPSRDHMIIDLWQSMTEERYRTTMNYGTGPANLVATRNPSRDHMMIDFWKSITEERYIELRWTMTLVQPTQWQHAILPETAWW